ncbi:cysteine-rich receptor-like protein kinase 10 isoform X2 [Pistacia vera]|uniref:cysteine-rich receptor-like protein kinase 10 isoform X2 n=1 Tax=Pistacia vera TaxID=55513 RepID=UPI001262DDE1|nr:cysteine-rich receptor-like protein kinase 10 isoform X2 [Pistacia vera]
MILSSLMAPKRVMLAAFFFIFSLEFYSAKTETWVKGGYWYSRSELPGLGINSALYTHLHCAFADVNSTSYELSLLESDEKKFSTFTDTVKQKNPSVVTLLSIGGGDANYSTFSSMVSNSSFRKSFIDSSIKTARVYGFQGLDLCWGSANSSSDMYNMGTLFEEWRAAIELEAGNSSQAKLILTAAVRFQPGLDSRSFPVEAMERYLDWANVLAYDYYTPQRYNFTSAQAALYDPTSNVNTDYGIRAWISRGLSANKMVLGLPFYGYAWTLANPAENGIGAPATGPALRTGGAINYKDIRDYVLEYGADVKYNATYVVNYCTVGSTWICFDDVEVVRIKVAYAKEKKLLGYIAWEIPYDDNWMLSQAAAQEGNNDGRNKRRLSAIVLSTSAAAILLLGCFLIYYFWIRKLKSKGSKKRINDPSAAGDFNSNAPNLITYNFHDIEAATDRFSFENKLGEGGYGPVYKALLPNGQEVAVKKLSKTSTQGYEEFRNEVMLTAKLQHVNLVRLLGFCTDREEQMLIYEYMPSKSLDYYLFDPIRRYILDWRKRVHIIEGITQGLLYLQEYSRLTIIHRDLKASNILLDEDMKPKISDFGMVRIFAKDELEVNTERVVGTYGYIPPEYVKRGIYSTKSDVYSFGVLLLQIISGNRVSLFYGLEENLSLLDYAYELWKEDKGTEFMDPSLDDMNSSCKLIKCLQIALLCVQENPNDRPSMLEVSSMLKNETFEIMSPKKPAFSIQADGDKETICTFNDTTISEVVGR